MVGFLKRKKHDLPRDFDPGGGSLAGGASFDPASLFAGGKLGVFYDTATLASLFQDRSLTPTTPAVVDGVVGTRKDLSGNNNHQLAPSDAARPILRTSAGKYWLEFDNIDDIITSNGSIALIGLSGAVFFGAGANNSGSTVLCHRAGASPFLGALTSGDDSAGSGFAATCFVDAVSTVNTRAALFSAIASASGVAPHLFEARNTNLTTFLNISTGLYGGFENLKRDYGLLAIAEADLGANEAALRTWFGQLMGLAL